jgi:asparagine synthetase B (glutamine-hydrolysing)
VLGYGSNKEPGQEYLEIRIFDHSNVTIDRDAAATMPLFYTTQHGSLVISNDYQAVVDAAPLLTPSLADIRALLVPNPHARPTLWRETGVLEADQVLTWKGGQADIKVVRERAWDCSRQAPASDPSRFFDIINDHLDSFIEGRLAGRRFCYEISGGIDSATLPLHHARRLPAGPPLSGAAIVYPGEFGRAQLDKLDLFASPLFHLTKTHVESTQDYPMLQALQGSARRPFYPFLEMYHVLVGRMVSLAAGSGVDTIVTGIGGDELFENTISRVQQLQLGASERERRRQAQYPPYLTEVFYGEHFDVADDTEQALPTLSVSTRGGPLSASNIYIDQGVWPVSPFLDKEIYQFCQGLPVHFRANKNILRAYHEAHGIPAKIHRPARNEHFGEFFAQALSSGSYDAVLDALVRNSLTAEMGYVDLRKLLETYQRCKERSDSLLIREWLVYLLAWMSLETNLQCVTRPELGDGD